MNPRHFQKNMFATRRTLLKKAAQENLTRNYVHKIYYAYACVKV